MTIQATAGLTAAQLIPGAPMALAAAVAGTHMEGGASFMNDNGQGVLEINYPVSVGNHFVPTRFCFVGPIDNTFYSARAGHPKVVREWLMKGIGDPEIVLAGVGKIQLDRNEVAFREGRGVNLAAGGRTLFYGLRYTEGGTASDWIRRHRFVDFPTLAHPLGLLAGEEVMGVLVADSIDDGGCGKLCALKKGGRPEIHSADLEVDSREEPKELDWSFNDSSIGFSLPWDAIRLDSLAQLFDLPAMSKAIDTAISLHDLRGRAATFYPTPTLPELWQRIRELEWYPLGSHLDSLLAGAGWAFEDRIMGLRAAGHIPGSGLSLIFPQ